MKVVNRSAYPTETIEAALGYVAAHLHYSFTVVLKVLDTEEGCVGCGGHAFKLDPDGIANTREPSLVKLWLGERPFYPAFSKNPAMTSGDEFVPWFYSVDEELVFTLAHELRHIDQFWGAVDVDPEDPVAMERDADEFAWQLLEEWRLALQEAS